MAWASPMTAVATEVWTAAQWNTHVRDNLNETCAGKATTAGSWFVATGANAIAERQIKAATVATAETTSSASYASLATNGPEITVTTGTRALVWISAQCSHSSANASINFSYELRSTGVTTIAADDSWSGQLDGVTAGDVNRFGVSHMVTNLTAGSNVFRMMYKTSGATATIQRREIVVMPF